MDGNYRRALDRIALTEQSKRALIRSLAGRAPGGARPRRALRASAVLILAAIVLAAAAGAAAWAVPVLRGYYAGAGYEQSGAPLGHSAVQDGWAMTLTDCVGDSRYLYLGLEVAAPEGTILDAEEYFLDQYSFSFPGLEHAGKAWFLRQLPDGDPSDGRLRFVLWIELYRPPEDGLNGQQMTLTLGGLYHHTGWNSAAKEWDVEYDCGGSWSFGELTVSYPDNTIRLAPNKTVCVLDVQATVTRVEVSPIGVYVAIEGDALRGHHNKYNNGYCTALPEITLWDRDGVALEPDKSAAPFGVRGGSGCSGGTDLSEPGGLYLVRSYGYLLDLNTLDHISVCGVDIPLR